MSINKLRSYIKNDDFFEGLRDSKNKDVFINDFDDFVNMIIENEDSVWVNEDFYVKSWELVFSKQRPMWTHYFEEILGRSHIRIDNSINYKQVISKIDKDTNNRDECILCVSEINCIRYICNIKEWMELHRELLLSTPQNDFCNNLSKPFPSLCFCEDNKQSISRISRTRYSQNVNIIIEHLGKLNNLAKGLWHSKKMLGNDEFCKNLSALAGIDISTESSRRATDNLTFKFIVNGNQVVKKCEKHTKVQRYGRNALRIYFEVLDDIVLIGYIGHHL